VGLSSAAGPIALPASWDVDARLARIPLGLVDGVPLAGAQACITFDEPGHTRPTEHRGLMLRGPGQLYADGDSGILAVEVDRVTYWSGFDTGTVDVTTEPRRRAASRVG